MRNPPVYLVMRAGVHLCSANMRGPLPPIQDLYFRFYGPDDEGWDGEWRVLHDAGEAMVVQACTVNEAYDEEKLLGMPEAGASRDLRAFVVDLLARAARNSGSVEDDLARAVTNSLGVSNPATANAASVFWAFQPGLEVETFPTVEDAAEVGLEP